MLTRRQVLAAGAGSALLGAGKSVSAQDMPTWREGPHLFLDAALAAPGTTARREMALPSRLPDPIVTGYEDGCFQPYITVIRSPETGRFRIWYGIPREPGNTNASSVATMESEDGIHFCRPHRVLKDPAPIQFGVSIIDEGPAFEDEAQRFKYGWWGNGGLRIAASPNGLEWTSLSNEPVVRHGHDINAIDWDPIRKRYIGLVSIVPDSGPYKGLRIPHQSVSKDFRSWSEPRMIITPDPHAAIEKGETQFYCMAGVIARGDLLIGLCKVLRDDLNCEPDKTAKELHDSGRPFAGLGYTVLAYSKDGENWTRETQPWLDRNPHPGTWDRAMAWGDDQIVVGDHTYVYYGGYRWGHKADRLTTRQIGFAHMPRDRYVAYTTGERDAIVRTPVRKLAGSIRFTANADIDVEGGEMWARLLNAQGQPLPGFDFADFKVLRGNRIDHPLAWKGSNSRLKGQQIALEFKLDKTRVFSFEVLA